MSENSVNYRVLARKYRPQTMSELVGQELLVKTLTQAIDANRLPHAFVLHGIRGVGKTTTARILAKALNCHGADGQGGPTANPCGICSSCISVTEDRHLDVIEMDAASRTGVDDIREVTESARYKAVNGRYKIFIIDEVHMLSKSAFNALLKTLEEPPPHVKFIFATTELKKIPETVLSRCMKFDLARITPTILFDYFKTICAKEQATIEDEALALLVRAADGSARDGLSLLDQAISLSQSQVTTDIVRDMLGVVDRGRMFILLNLLMEGKIAEVIAEVRDLYARGSEPTVLLHDLLDLVYWVTSLKINTSLLTDITWPESDRREGGELANKLSMPILMRAWQVLSKGYEEVARSPLPNQAVEMVLIRLAYLSDLPSAEDLLKLTSGGGAAGGGMSAPRGAASVTSSLPQAMAMPISRPAGLSGVPVTSLLQPMPEIFQDVLKIVAQSREPLLYSNLMQDIHLVSFSTGKIVLRLGDKAPSTLPTQLQNLLHQQTGQKWDIDIVAEGGAATVVEQNRQQMQQLEQSALNHPLIQEMMTQFPGLTAKVERQETIH
ncbi:DNA polymerase III subunit gamma/tau [Candidatus Odyssella acanthamoebae]|uniref:DNA polymerase III subunit gamma/tau n=1 Tax=Candidatus Odyssella acanthamoebae TaxID=91604 RepID=A0A077AYT9_9PROT|nr:DNA polymerase III subunit gamma/tau [Candidatus Paracaedibacter acanthamoebae]AIK97169.1 DNA polymerase III subunit gamma/tau [Candidatus Paracaedibacter acanthamoebae]